MAFTSSEEVDVCREAFAAFASAHGRVEVRHLRTILESVGGHKPSEEELFSMVAEIDVGMAGELELDAFLRVIELQKRRVTAQNEDDSDLIDAFVACGGNPDTSGVVERATLVRIIKVSFGLTIDIEALIDSVDKDGSGEIEWGEFKELLTKKDSVVGGG